MPRGRIPPSVQPSAVQRVPAPHVQAAITQTTVQAKTQFGARAPGPADSSPPVAPPSPIRTTGSCAVHVEAALARCVQPKLPVPPPSPIRTTGGGALHVEAALARGAQPNPHKGIQPLSSSPQVQARVVAPPRVRIEPPALAIQPMMSTKEMKKEKLVDTGGKKYKKKAKEREVQSKVDETLEKRVKSWVYDYGHSTERHVGLTRDQLVGRNKPTATTFEEKSDLECAALAVITANEKKLNSWYEKQEETRITLWAYLPKECSVRGVYKLTRPDWHYKVDIMPPHPGYGDIDSDDLLYVVGIFDLNAWSMNPMGLVTCYPSTEKPG